MPDDDPALPWAQPSICQQKGLSLRRSPWDHGDHPDPAEEAARAVAVRVQCHHEAPQSAARLGIPRPSREDLETLHRDWPAMAREHRLPPAAEWKE
jgi:hypothetical protein